MATTGAFNGTDVFIRVLTDTGWFPIGGQISHSETLNNSLLDITNKIGSNKFRELLPDEGMQSVDYSVEMVFTSQAGFDFVRAAAGDKSINLYQVVRGDIPTGTVPIEVNLQVQSFVDNSADNEPLKATVSLLSSDEFDFNLNATYEKLLTSDGDNFLTSNGDQVYVRST